MAFGSYNVTVSYSGDNYTVGFDNFNLTTLAVKNNLTVGVNVSSVVEYNPFMLNVTFPVDAVGNVTVTFGNQTFNGTVLNGYALVAVDNLSFGVYDVSVSYSGDDKYIDFVRCISIY